MKKFLNSLVKQFHYFIFSGYKIQTLFFQMTNNDVIWDYTRAYALSKVEKSF